MEIKYKGLLEIKKDLQTIFDILTESNDLYLNINLIRTYSTFNKLLSSNNNLYADNNQKLLNLIQERKVLKEAKDKVIKSHRQTTRNLTLYKTQYLKILDNYIKSLFQFSSETKILTSKSTTISEKELLTILYLYYSKEDPKSLDLFKFIIVKGNILLYKEDDTSGYALYGNGIVTDKIALNKEQEIGYTLNDALAIVHEIEHIKFLSTTGQNSTEKEKYKNNSYNIYNELNTNIIEKRFIQFLINNNILEDQAKILLIQQYNQICITSYKVIEGKVDYEYRIPALYSSYTADILLDNTNYDYDLALNTSYRLISSNQKSKNPYEVVGRPTSDMKKVLKRQFQKIAH